MPKLIQKAQIPRPPWPKLHEAWIPATCIVIGAVLFEISLCLLLSWYKLYKLDSVELQDGTL